MALDAMLAWNLPSHVKGQYLAFPTLEDTLITLWQTAMRFSCKTVSAISFIWISSYL